MSVERVGISKKSENHIQKKSTPFLWTSFQGVGKSPPGWDFPPTSLLLRGVGFQPGGGGISSPPPTTYKKFSHDRHLLNIALQIFDSENCGLLCVFLAFGCRGFPSSPPNPP